MLSLCLHPIYVNETGKEIRMEMIYSPQSQQQGIGALQDNGITCPDFAGSCPRQVACTTLCIGWSPCPSACPLNCSFIAGCTIAF